MLSAESFLFLGGQKQASALPPLRFVWPMEQEELERFPLCSWAAGWNRVRLGFLIAESGVLCGVGRLCQ